MPNIITHLRIIIVLVAVMVGPAMANPSKTLVIDSKPIHIDRVFKSMAGPEEIIANVLKDRPALNVTWLTEIKMHIAKDGAEGSQDQYFCHAYLSIGRGSLQKWRKAEPSILVQGKGSTKLPKGFGIPVANSEKLNLHMMMVNSQAIEAPFDLKYQTTLTYQEQTDANLPLKALTQLPISMLVPVQLEMKGRPEYKGFTHKVIASHNAGQWTSETGKKMTMHWNVPPGRQRYSMELEKRKTERKEIQVHFISSHLHPYGEYVEIKDVTEDKVIFRSEATQFKDWPGIAKLSHYSSVEGVTFYKDHDYVMTTQYNNTTDQPIDAMAVLHLYFHNTRLEDNIKQLFQ